MNSIHFFNIFLVLGIAESRVVFTTTPSKCIVNGKVYPPGDFQPSPCEYCTCDISGRHSCAVTDCFWTPCVNPVHHKDQCCPTCPDGRNCRNGNQTVPEGKVVHLDATTTCTCHRGGQPALCQKIATLPPGCMYQGKLYQFGSFKPSPCKHCQCDPSGRAYCAIEDCFFTRCVDSVHRNDTCCPVCPNGANCYAGNKTIPAGKDVQIDSQTTCRCPSPSHSGFLFGVNANNAICSIKPTASIETTSVP